MRPGPYWWWINIDSGNDLVQSNNKPLLEAMLTQIYATIWRHGATMSRQVINSHIFNGFDVDFT